MADLGVFKEVFEIFGNDQRGSRFAPHSMIVKTGVAALGIVTAVGLHLAASPAAHTATAAPCNAYEHNHVGVPGVVNPEYPDCDELVPGDAPIDPANPHAPIVHPPAPAP